VRRITFSNHSLEETDAEETRGRKWADERTPILEEIKKLVDIPTDA
jgi:hypothetical protein